MSEGVLPAARKICLIKADRIGDIVLLSGYLRYLAESLPEARLDLHVAPDMLDLAPLLHPRVNVAALPFSRHLDVADTELASWLWDIDHRGYDTLVIPRFTLGEADVLALRYLSLEQRHGFPNFENPIPEDWLTLRLGPAKREMGESLQGPQVDPWSSEVEKYAALARWQGLAARVADLEPALYLDGEPISTSSRRQGVLVWPGASEPHKRWPVARFQALLELLDRKGEAITVGGTPGEERIVNDLLEILAKQSPDKWICDTGDLERTVRRLTEFRAVVANDTGIAHLAAAAGCRVISVSSAVHEGRFLVRGNRSTTVFADVPCRRCKGDCIFDEPVWPCVTEIQPEEIAARIDLSRRPPTKLTVSAPTFERDPQRLLASVSSLHARTTMNRKREVAQLHASRMIADDLRRRAEAEVQQLQRERQAAQDRLASLEADAQSAPELRQHVESLRRESADLQQQRAQMEQKVAALQEEARAAMELRGQVEALQAATQQAADAARADRKLCESARAQLAEARGEKEAALARERDLLEQLERLSQAVSKSSDQVERLSHAVSTTSEHADRLSAQRERLASARQEDRAEIDSLRRRLSDADGKLERLQHTLRDREAQTRELIDQLGHSESEREELSNRMSELAEDKQQLVREFDSLVSHSSQLASQVNSLETELQRAEATVRERFADLERHRAQRRETARRLRELRRARGEALAWSEALVHAGYRPAPQRHTWLGPPASAADHPRISIVTPSYNTARFIGETIESVLAQDYPDYEHIVVDSASSDGTLDICARYPHLRWVVEKDHGQSHAINRGLLMSTGEIVAYLNSDDVYRPGAFKAVARYFREHPECMILVGDCDLIDERGAPVGHWQAKAGRWVDRVRYWGWERTHCIPQQSLFIRRELLTRIGLFDADLHMVMDLDMWLRATRENELGVVNQTLAAFRLVEGTKTISRTHEMYVEQLDICRRHAAYLPFGQWLVTEIEVRRHFAGMMLKMSEHYIFNADKRRLPLGLLLHGVREWPMLLLNPRSYLTAAQCLTRKSRLWPAVAQPHRAYLGVLWRLRNLRKNSASSS